MSKLSQFIGAKEEMPIGAGMYIYSENATVVVDGNTYLRSGVLANPATYPLVTVINAPGSVWTQISLPTFYTNWYRIVYGNGIYLISSPSSLISATSPDGINWTQRAVPSTSIFDMVFSDGLFVALSKSTGPTLYRLSTSADGITWTNKAVVPTFFWDAVCYGNGLFVIIGNNSDGVTLTNTILTSNDGSVTLTSRTLPVNSWWKSIAYGNGTYVIVTDAGNNIAVRSSDGITWTQSSLTVNGYWNSITYGNGLFVVVGEPASGASNNCCMTSPDGITWTT